jgi:adenylate cyclase class 2
VEKAGPLDVFLSNKTFLRIRVQDEKKIIFTAKVTKGKNGESLIKREHEVTVDSEGELRGILSLIGYQEAVRVKKIRQTAQNGEYEICIDDIEGLGSFIEVEAICKEENADEIQSELWKFLESLGVSPEDQVTKGYDILMLERK